MTDKVRENKMRRMADRQGLRLVKSRRRDENALDHGLYGLIDLETNGTVFGSNPINTIFTATLDEVEEWLTSTSKS